MGPRQLPTGVKSFRYHLTDPPQFDIMQSGPGWRGSNAIRSIKTACFHHAARWRGGGVATRGTRAAAGDASGWAREETSIYCVISADEQGQ
jgi:hypothetical protein